jgi:hypothetical protein
MRRREFIALLGVATVAWPVVAGAQQGERVCRVGVLLNLTAEQPEAKIRVPAFVQMLAELGWTEGNNLVTTRAITASATAGG